MLVDIAEEALTEQEQVEAEQEMEQEIEEEKRRAEFASRPPAPSSAYVSSAPPKPPACPQLSEVVRHLPDEQKQAVLNLDEVGKENFLKNVHHILMKTYERERSRWEAEQEKKRSQQADRARREELARRMQAQQRQMIEHQQRLMQQQQQNLFLQQQNPAYRAQMEKFQQQQLQVMENRRLAGLPPQLMAGAGTAFRPPLSSSSQQAGLPMATLSSYPQQQQMPWNMQNFAPRGLVHSIQPQPLTSMMTQQQPVTSSISSSNRPTLANANKQSAITISDDDDDEPPPPLVPLR
eukprot:gb/GEZN01011241.1/.p1 GENE.gb/GEZN01011241.1/~~gb/GEZN01011241.1/.p1  ORF type:complete len:332 (-),score=98.28 gb/GEZN01011241.1/:180-1058(-)